MLMLAQLVLAQLMLMLAQLVLAQLMLMLVQLMLMLGSWCWWWRSRS
jgi:hypothetical protein